MALIACKDCGKKFSTDAKHCPDCGANPPKIKRPTSRAMKLFLVFFALAVVLPRFMLTRTSEERAAEAKVKQDPIAAAVGPATPGDPFKVAYRAIKEADHPCPKVVSAVRNPDGAISATCSNKEDYRVFTLNGKNVTMRCSAARRLGVSGC